MCEKKKGGFIEKMTVHVARAGWSEAEKAMLADAVKKADESGASLRSVFEETGERLNRKPNSVRNFYYLQLRNQEGAGMQRAVPFVTFTEEEIHGLVKRILLGKSRGKSVRACVMEMADGDKAAMLRYQNKYRSVLKKKPEMITDVLQELAEEGCICPNPLDDLQQRDGQRNEKDYFRHLQALDRMKVQQDMMRIQLEDMQLAARSILLLCKDFLALLPEEKQGNLEAFCQELACRLTVLENAAN